MIGFINMIPLRIIILSGLMLITALLFALDSPVITIGKSRKKKHRRAFGERAHLYNIAEDKQEW